MMKPNRFDYVRYDDLAQEKSAAFKRLFMDVEQFVENNISVPPGPEGQAVARAKASILTNLEVAYMWVGKAIRDEQITVRGPASLQEERNNE